MKIQRITYRQLRTLLDLLTEDQLDCDVTVENGQIDECFVADLRSCTKDHDSLDTWHPVIYFNDEYTVSERLSKEEMKELIEDFLMEKDIQESRYE